MRLSTQVDFQHEASRLQSVLILTEKSVALEKTVCFPLANQDVYVTLEDPGRNYRDGDKLDRGRRSIGCGVVEAAALD